MKREVVALGLALCIIACERDLPSPATRASVQEPHTAAEPTPAERLTDREYAELVCVAGDLLENPSVMGAIEFYEWQIAKLENVRPPEGWEWIHNYGIQLNRLLLAKAHLNEGPQTPNQLAELRRIGNEIEKNYFYGSSRLVADAWLVWDWIGCHWERPAEIGTEYPHDLNLHCGIWWARFDSRDWLPHTPAELDGANAPPGWDHPHGGTMVLVKPDLARYTNPPTGESVYFTPWPPDQEIMLCY